MDIVYSAASGPVVDASLLGRSPAAFLVNLLKFNQLHHCHCLWSLVFIQRLTTSPDYLSRFSYTICTILNFILFSCIFFTISILMYLRLSCYTFFVFSYGIPFLFLVLHPRHPCYEIIPFHACCPKKPKRKFPVAVQPLICLMLSFYFFCQTLPSSKSNNSDV